MLCVPKKKIGSETDEPQKSPLSHPFAIFHFNVEADVTAHAALFLMRTSNLGSCRVSEREKVKRRVMILWGGERAVVFFISTGAMRDLQGQAACGDSRLAANLPVIPLLPACL